MYYDEFFPFYAVYADPEVYARELQQEREAELMRARYPQTVRKLQDYIHEEADLMDYQAAGFMMNIRSVDDEKRV